ncbi:hypothetical protein NP233_g12842 [Leucocoprinus birnbaumii]|uniref:Protein kinase domain-containing protein n=1 Tax=Leucocoprinus birnbaumii TaxID=56174 RepID=A0AAD5VE47_9AGAR|nr:hypothetical protein NP233_g12842 [Leucocoprinus birnbaumii]
MPGLEESLAPASLPFDLERVGYPDLTGLVRRDDGVPPHPGGYSDIHIGYLIESPVAIKVLRTSGDPDRIERVKARLYSEAIVWTKLQHENVLPFLGLAQDLGRFGCPAYIFPFCNNGSITDYIHSTNPGVMDRALLVLGVARGLGYLHENDVIHGGLKPSNILVGDGGRSLVSDFGSNWLSNTGGFSTRPADTFRYQAPELLMDNDRPPNRSTDVCAFGLTAFEVWTSLPPFSEAPSEIAVIVARLMKGVVEPPLPVPPPAMMELFWPVLSPCFKNDQDARPTMQVVVEELISGITAAGYLVGASTSPPHGRDVETREVIDKDDSGVYRRCRALAMETVTLNSKRRALENLEGEDAQIIVDFLDRLLDDEDLEKRKKKKIIHLLSSIAKSAKVFPKSLEIPNVQCDLSSPVAEGGYGIIFRGNQQGHQVCVKAIRMYEKDKNIERKLRAQASELTIWANLSHVNVLPFLGMYFSNERKNVLISGNKRALLADFGISRVSMTSASPIPSITAGTTHWMAPEMLIEDFSTPTKEGDIWAFGCVCYEALTGLMPFYQFKPVAQLILAFIKKIATCIKPVVLASGLSWDDATQGIWSAAELCWAYDPNKRPDSGELLLLLASMNALDDRSPEPRSPRSKIKASRLNYDHVLNTLSRISYVGQAADIPGLADPSLMIQTTSRKVSVWTVLSTFHSSRFADVY